MRQVFVWVFRFSCVRFILRLLLRAGQESKPWESSKKTVSLWILNIELHGVEKFFHILFSIELFAYTRLLLILVLYLQIAVVAVMCKPHRCPHINMTGNICVYCPGGPDSDFEYSTQSYTGYEPTSMRAIRARYNPYLQTRHRIEQVCLYKISGLFFNNSVHENFLAWYIYSK